MTGLLYLASIFGVLWLALWMLMDRVEKRPFWMPFDFKNSDDNEQVIADSAPAPRRDTAQGWRNRTTEARRRR